MKYKGILVESLPDLLEACNICLKAELRRRKDLTDGSPASRYTDARIKKIQAAIFLATGK